MFSEFFINRPVLSNVIAWIIVLLGLVAINTLPVSMYPPITPPTVQVTTHYPGANSQTVMETVALPIEQQVNGIEDMIYMSSTATNDGVYTLTITFKIGTDLDFAQVLVQNRVAAATSKLPNAVQQQGVVTQKQSTSILEVVNLQSPNGTYDPLFLSNYAIIHLKDELARLPGVGSLTILGLGQYSMRVWLDPGLMNERGLMPSDVVNAIQSQNQKVSAGQLGQPPTPDGQDFQLTVNLYGAYSTAEEFEEIIVSTGQETGGAVTRIKDIGRVELGAATYSQSSRFNGKAAAGIAVFQLPEANALDVAREVEAKMEELAKNFPEDLTYNIPFNTTMFVDATVDEVYKTLIEAAFLVLIVIVLFLQNFRAMLVPMTTVPVSIIGAFAAMAVMGFSINLITLFAIILAIAIVVDDAIVIVEAVSKHIESGMTPHDAAVKAMKQLTGPIFGITLVLISVFLPAAFMPGLTGEVYRQFALVIAATAVISAINALTLKPMQCAHWLRPVDINKKKNFVFRGFNVIFEKLQKGYTRLIYRIVTNDKKMVVIALAITCIAIFGLSRVPTGFVPIEDQGYMMASIELPEAASLERTNEALKDMSERFLKVPGVKDVVAIGGAAALYNMASMSNAGVSYIILDSWNERYKSANKKEQGLMGIFENLSASVADLEEASIFVLPPPPIQGLGLAGGFELQLELKDNSEDFTKLQNAQNILIEEANKEPAVRMAIAPFRANVPQVDVEVNRTQTEVMGVALGDLFNTVEGYLGSTYAGQFTRFGRTFDVFVQGDGQYRIQPENISQLHVRGATNNMVPIGSVADISNTLGPNIVSLYNLYPTAPIIGLTETGYSSGQAMQAIEKIANEKLPEGVGYQWTGTSYQEELLGNTAYFIFGLSLLLIYLVLAGQYESWYLPGSVILSVPLALVGIVILLLSIPLLDNNIYVQIGLVLLIAMSAKNGILIVEVARELRGQGKSIIDSAVEAATIRFRPILMTSFTLLLGVLPLVLAEGAGASARKSLGITVFSGMLSSTCLAVLFIPAFYVLIQTWEENRKAKNLTKTQ
ncbi:MAG: efflux RND transporter permease subunit [Pseudomonadota bacterium]